MLKKFLLFLFVAILVLSLNLPLKKLFNRGEEKEEISAKLVMVLGENEDEEQPTDRPDQALLYEKVLRSEIGKPFSYKGNWKFKAYQQARQTFSLRKATQLNWQERGPANVGGRTRALVVHPQNESIWWAGAVGGGVWKTEDAGQHWRPLTDHMPVISVTTLAICQTQPDILYAGTGEGFGNYDRVIGDGIFKTLDGGENWEQLASTADNYDFRYVNRVVVHPQHPDTLLAATNTGVFRSFDGGQTWSLVLTAGNRVQQIVANPLNFSTLFAAVNTNGIYKSVDLGQTWKKVSTSFEEHRRVELAIAQSDTNFIYVAAANSSGELAGFYRSTNAGISWQKLGSSPNWLGNQGWYDNTLIVHPFNENIIFVGGIDLYQITAYDHSMSAIQISSWWGGNGLPYVHADHHCLVTIPHADSTFALISTNDGGVFYSSDGGVHWEARNNQYNVTQYYDADKHPHLSQYVGGTQDNGTHVSPIDPDNTTGWRRAIGGDGFDCAWDRFDPAIVYGTLYDSRIYKSVDGGNSFIGINNGLPESNIFHTPLTMDPNNPERLFTISESNKIYRTTDAGFTWHGYSVDLGGYSYVKIAVSPVNSNIVWIGSSEDHINVSTDGGQNFQTTVRPENAPNAFLTGIAVHPSDSAQALVTFGVSGYGKIFRTRDLGQSWQDITANLPDVPVHCAIWLPYDTTQIWIGTDIGLFISIDNGQSWSFANGNLPSVSIRRLKIVGKEIVAATHGRGIWSIYDENLPGIVAPARPPVLQDLTPPNPLTNTMKIYFKTRFQYDSVHVDVNGEVLGTLGKVPAYVDTFALIQVQPPDYLEIKVVGYDGKEPYVSDQDELFIYESAEQAEFDFDSGFSDFYGDFFIETPSGFANSGLQTEHPYFNQRDYVAVLGTPIVIKEKTILSYKDIAIVEPGEKGYYYPDYRMWDYVTVEASLDGENWQIIVTPYDCRFDVSWQNSYDSSNDPAPIQFKEHQVNLSEIFQQGEIVYIRFRLHADEYQTGWGWIIDDFAVKPVTETALANASPPAKFELFDNYPNPFNPQTTISFTLDRTGAVSLKIYNSAGQLVRTLINQQKLFKGNLYQYRWLGRNDQGNPVASGVYFYRLKTENHSVIKKMVLMR
ncbi:MAG: T9SS type A sorting domain-containing protein [Caldisericaceae bacterium]|nr:T9SS type A sorting domain-containing protein [Caldisericaceae bacterium]